MLSDCREKCSLAYNSICQNLWTLVGGEFTRLRAICHISTKLDLICNYLTKTIISSVGKQYLTRLDTREVLAILAANNPLKMANGGSRSQGDQRTSSARNSTARRNESGSRSSSSSSGKVTVRCTHYKRECNMVAPCCGRIVCCEIGHDSSDRCLNKLDGHVDQVRTLVCCDSNLKQDIRNACKKCKISFGKYSCMKCRKWSDKESFHCDYCGICRQGRKEWTKHCPVCSKCYPLSLKAHVCTTNSNCVGCGKDTHYSRELSTNMPCGHAMHQSCFMRRVQNKYTCPKKDVRKTCRKHRPLEECARQTL